MQKESQTLFSMSAKPYLSVIIPAYNEAGRIKSSLSQIYRYLSAQNYSWEIVVADDGSKDQTLQIARDYLKGIPAIFLESLENQGKGAAVQRGMLAARGDYLLFTDADLSTPIEEVSGFLDQLHKGYDIVIGSRGLENSNVEIKQGWMRQTMGKTFNRILKWISLTRFKDTQCGFKCFSRRAAMDLFSRQKIKGFGFDVEIMYLAERRGYHVLESPVIWRNSPHSRVNIFKDPILMLWDAMRLRWLHRNQ